MLGYRILEITIMKWSIYWEIVDSLASKQPHNECCSKIVTAVIRRGSINQLAATVAECHPIAGMAAAVSHHSGSSILSK